MALPWGRSGGSGSLPTGDVEISLLTCGGTPADSLFRMLSARSMTPQYPTVDGCVVGPPGAAYEIQISLHERVPVIGAKRVVRATIDGTEVNEQLILRSSSTSSAKFVGWLQDETGSKRIHFTFPTHDRESLVQVGIFDATEHDSEKGKGKQRAAPSPPVTATGASFEGPLVGNSRFTLGAPVAIGALRLKAEQRR